MGAIIFKVRDLQTQTSEIVGYKSGLALNEDELRAYAPDDLKDVLGSDPESMIRLRAEVMEELIAEILYRLGTIPTPEIIPSHIRLFSKVRHNPDLLRVYTDIMSGLPLFLESAMDQAEKEGKKTIDPTPFVNDAQKKHGTLGMDMACDLMIGLNKDQIRNPWLPFRETDWKDVKELQELFKSESLETMHGTFFDQRFVDFLAANYSDIDKINWRKFEGMVCEFFQKSNMEVEVGPGRNDDGIDARVWPKAKDKSLPPTIIVQCKRQKERVDKVVVKSLYADILAEDAKSGLIVTTSALSPGAKKVCKARSYPIDTVDRRRLKQWIEQMRTPKRGIFLGE